MSESPAVPEPAAREDLRLRIITAAARLLEAGGRDAVTTRTVAAAAGVQPPAIYRIFGDKGALLDAVAEHGFATYLDEKHFRPAGPDPVEDLRAGWDLHVEFGLAHPALYLLMYADPHAGRPSPAAAAARRVLEHHLHRVAATGRLRVGERLAADLVHAAGSGVVFTLLATPEPDRAPDLAHVARESVLAAITTGAGPAEPPAAATAAVTLRAVLPDATELSEAERHLMVEWLDRLAAP